MGRKTESLYLRMPGPGRPSLTLYVKHPDGRSTKLSNERIEAINANLKAGLVDAAQAGKLAREVMESVRRARLPSGPNVSDANMDVFTKYWNQYRRKKSAENSKDSARYGILRALRALGELELLSASIEDLQDKVDTLTRSRQRRVVSILNSLLSFVGRKEKLNRAPKQRKPVRHIRLDELPELLKHVDSDMERLVIQVAFYTGARQGEVFAINQLHPDGYVVISGQYDRDGEWLETKTRSVRSAVVHPAGVGAVREWCKVGQDARAAQRAKRWSDIVDAAAKKIGKEKLTFHDLRHSYAIEALSAGFSMEWVANSLGNSVAVCEEYYAGFALTDVAAKAMAEMWKKRNLYNAD